jgi:hypothetical protein
MERRNLLVGLTVLLIGVFALSGTALAHKAPKKKPASESSATCTVVSLPSFVDQGEFSAAGSVADIIEVHCQSVYAEQYVKLSATELYDRCHDLSWAPDNTEEQGSDGPTLNHVQLDDAGNATVGLIAGPSCASGESLISAHLEEAPYETFTTSFTVLPPHATTPGVTTLPSSQVEDDLTSSVATIVEVEFPSVYAEQYVNINAEQLYARCQNPDHLTWDGPLGEEGYYLGDGETQDVQLDNSGNAFALVFGYSSCASGSSLIEASLLKAPYTTYTTEFTVKSPENLQAG